MQGIRPRPGDDDGLLYAPPGDELRPYAEGIAWLWRLGRPLDRPAPQAIGFAGIRRSGELRRLVAERRLRAGVVFAGDAGNELAGVPARRHVAGTARFPGGACVRGRFCVFAGGMPVVRSSLGLHGVARDGLLLLGTDSSQWGELSSFWVLPALADFLVHHVDRPLVGLPPMGCLRFDDLPGTAELQIKRRAKPDARQARLVRSLARKLEADGSRMVLAVPARALRGNDFVPIDRVWPRALAAIRDGVARGVFEVAGHGLHHLSLRHRSSGQVEPGEFAELSEFAAGRALDESLTWLAANLGRPETFIAPAWKYSEGTLRAARGRAVPVWRFADPGPLLRRNQLYETLQCGLPGLHRLDYAPLRSLISIGLPLTVVFHGRSLDGRLRRLLARRSFATLIRLAAHRDMDRIRELPFVQWVGGRELLEYLRLHAQVRVDGERVHAPTRMPATVVDRRGRRLAELVPPQFARIAHSLSSR